jgi:hypothetical protein
MIFWIVSIVRTSKGKKEKFPDALSQKTEHRELFNISFSLKFI